MTWVGDGTPRTIRSIVDQWRSGDGELLCGGETCAYGVYVCEREVPKNELI